MGQYRTMQGMRRVRGEYGFDKAGRLVRVDELVRETGSTLGVRFVSVTVNGEGVRTEQFSGSRVNLARQAVETLFDEYTAAGADIRTAGQKAAATRRLRQAGLLPPSAAQSGQSAPTISNAAQMDALRLKRHLAAVKANQTRKFRKGLI